MYPVAPEGWFHSSLYNQYQRVNNKVYVYVIRNLYGWQAQLYSRGNISLCELEVRTSDVTENGFMKMISLGDQWLEAYGPDDSSELEKDTYHIANPDGVWGMKHRDKRSFGYEKQYAFNRNYGWHFLPVRNDRRVAT
jgi:hypothetical protein